MATPNNVRLRDVSTARIVASGAIAFAPDTDTLKGSGAITCSGAMAFASSPNTLSGTGGITESAAIAFASSPNTVKGAGAITESGAIAFANSDTAKGAGAITEAGALAFASLDTLRGAGAIVESGAIILSTTVEFPASDIVSPTETIPGAGSGPLPRWSLKTLKLRIEADLVQPAQTCSGDGRIGFTGSGKAKQRAIKVSGSGCTYAERWTYKLTKGGRVCGVVLETSPADCLTEDQRALKMCLKLMEEIDRDEEARLEKIFDFIFSHPDCTRVEFKQDGELVEK